MDNGSLEIILGPMFSGKTTRIIERYKHFVSNKMTAVAINFANDTRYHDTMLSTHDKEMIPCIQCMNLDEIIKNDVITNYTHILINEGQFFEDVYETTLLLVEKFKKHVTICGLDGDFKRVKFGKILDLIPFCDKVIKLSSICDCGHPAIFSHRITKETSQIVIGSSNYKPLCRKCYNQQNLV